MEHLNGGYGSGPSPGQQSYAGSRDAPSPPPKTFSPKVAEKDKGSDEQPTITVNR